MPEEEALCADLPFAELKAITPTVYDTPFVRPVIVIEVPVHIVPIVSDEAETAYTL